MTSGKSTSVFLFVGLVRIKVKHRLCVLPIWYPSLFRLLFLFAFTASLTIAIKFIKLAKSTAAIKSPLFLTIYSRDRHEIVFVHHGEKIPRNRHTTTVRGNSNRLIPSERVLTHNPGEKRAHRSTVDDPFLIMPRLLQSEAPIRSIYRSLEIPRIVTANSYISCIRLMCEFAKLQPTQFSARDTDDLSVCKVPFISSLRTHNNNKRRECTKQKQQNPIFNNI